ncbi:phosphatidate cytidylyltransferase 4, chloroplastic-like [Humulus lupulus]|uniref:phosphatidate cytidylyltransferase 4, chloroplastic-like n=1 Tax=Humulus lupulus TaxID=3486 RepID=UPI002B4157BF|nr:phosphatidate cytidylyltransferase 4, chloroplastic-like [Humulus lupulus]
MKTLLNSTSELHPLMATTSSYVELDRYKLIPFSFSPLRACPCRPLPSKPIIFSRVSANFGQMGLFLDGSKAKRTFWFSRKGVVSPRRRFITAFAPAQPGSLNGDNVEQEVDKGQTKSMSVDTASESQQKASQLKKRIVFGLGIGISVGAVVLAGGWVFTVAFAAAIFVGSREYFELVRSRGITSGMTPPPRYVSRTCSVICALMPILTLYFGHIDVSVTSAAFIVAMALLLQRGNPRFSQLSSTMFGLFYCGYLPCFWVKLRCGLAVPALNTTIGASWPTLLGGPTHWTIGLVATLISISSIIAADTCAFLGGKAFGRTPLISVSPKKTWEGTIAGLGGCIATSVVLSKILCWPKSMLSAIAFGFLNFIGSVFGDLTESMIKRDAGVKDSGSLIPGHGGILDRVDSYVFTGALAYSFVKIFLPLYGV